LKVVIFLENSDKSAGNVLVDG